MKLGNPWVRRGRPHLHVDKAKLVLTLKGLQDGILERASRRDVLSDVDYILECGAHAQTYHLGVGQECFMTLKTGQILAKLGGWSELQGHSSGVFRKHTCPLFIVYLGLVLISPSL